MSENSGLICNWEAAVARLGGAVEILESMVDLFLEEQQSYIENIYQALKDVDASRLERELHTLKGVSATVGGEKLEQQTQVLETFAAQNKFAEIANAMPDIEASVTELNEFLQAKLTSS